MTGFGSLRATTGLGTTGVVCGPCSPNSSATGAQSPNLITQSARISVLAAPQRTGEPGPLEVRITDSAGVPITSYDTVHTAKMHLFTINQSGESTDLGDFQHLHPESLGDGRWRIPSVTLHKAGTTSIIANFLTGGTNTAAQTSIDVGVGAAAAEADQSGGYHATVATTSNGPAGPQVQLTVTDAAGMPVTQASPIFDAWAHLIVFRASDQRGAPVGFSHGHAMMQMQGGLLTADMGAMAPGSWQGYLQMAGPDGTPRSIPVRFTWPG